MMPDSFSSQGGFARTAGRAWLMPALQHTRARTLALFAAYEKGLAASNLVVPMSAEVNPPLWELGHIGWFQEWWIARNRERELGVAGNPGAARGPSRLAGADSLYDSSRVPHDDRWSLPLPDVAVTRQYLREGLGDTLTLLDSCDEDDASLYFFRLVLLHEDMHSEASVYMAQALGIPMATQAAFPRGDIPMSTESRGSINVVENMWRLGSGAHEGGFAFDNELNANDVALAAFEIDSAAVTWRRYLLFVEAGGYEDARWWTAEGWQWRLRAGLKAPRYLRQQSGQWLQQQFGRDQPLDLASPAIHLSHHEAQAWCRWSDRRLPSEAEWECAAMTQPDFRWGQVWEWTADPFMAFSGFTPHPYRDYSMPWFGSRQVLRGASVATSPHMTHPKYRNFFTPDRNDIFAGFRSCAGA